MRLSENSFKLGHLSEARAYIKGAKHEAKNVLFFLGSQDLQYKSATVVGEAVSNLVAETKRVWPNVKVILSTVLPSVLSYDVWSQETTTFIL